MTLKMYRSLIHPEKWCRSLLMVTFIVSGMPRNDARGDDTPPRSLDPQLKIELFAEHPQIVTPTGMDVDSQGRVWALESNTHFPPKEYQRHPSDRLLVMRDSDADGRANAVVTFADGFTHAMSVVVRPDWLAPVAIEGDWEPVNRGESQPYELEVQKLATTGISEKNPLQVYVATRRQISLLEDTDGDLRADRMIRLIHLETVGNYPHNGLAGFAFAADGSLFFGLGENLGVPYSLVGRDGTELKGGGEGGNVYRMRPDGSAMTFWATGFWNPHASCIDGFGNLFTVDNDPDSRPPCRLLHVIESGDYGFRFRNGRKGLHPFTSWNGEVPGTLPMVAGTGEAPSGILACENAAWPEEYRGTLLSTSWGDHRIDRFRLKPMGVSFESVAQPIIVGGVNFRPVGIAMAPAGETFCTDWVLPDYQLHGKGRIWKISTVSARKTNDDATAEGVSIEDLSKRLEHPQLSVRRRAAQEIVRATKSNDELKSVIDSSPAGTRARYELESARRAAGREPSEGFATEEEVTQDSIRRRVTSTDKFQLAGEVRRLLRLARTAQTGHANKIVELFKSSLNSAPANEDRDRSAVRIVLLLCTRQIEPENEELVRLALSHGDPEVRRIAVQWAAESCLESLKSEVSQAGTRSPVTMELFSASLAASEMLAGKNPQQFDQTGTAKYVLPLLKDSDVADQTKALALGLIDPADPGLTIEQLSSLLASSDKRLQLEVVRTLQTSPLKLAPSLLEQIARDEGKSQQLRNEAIIGLARVWREDSSNAQIRPCLEQLLKSADRTVREEALRAGRSVFATQPELSKLLEETSKAWESSATERADRQELVEQRGLLAALSGDRRTASTPQARVDRPRDSGGWIAELESAGAGNPAAGRRTFFHPNGPGCSKCHTVNGRGGRIGPDLSQIGKSAAKEKLIQSILFPSIEIAPQFVQWNFVAEDGRVHTGMIVHENEGKTIIGTSQGTMFELPTATIEERVPQSTSVMPEKLVQQMSVREFRDLLAYLANPALADP